MTTGAVTSDAPAVEIPRGGGFLEAIDNRLNPILVKEVRQALQGKFFRWLFLITLIAATVIGCGQILLTDEISQLSGREFFLPMFACLSAAVHVFVPFSVFTSLGSEWEENTYDLLVISGLRPRQIVLGKLLSAGTQVLLYYSAFGPFLVFAFLLKGLDLFAVGVILVAVLFSSCLLSCFALALSSLSRQRVIRVLLLTLLAGTLVQCTVGSVGAAFGIIRASNALHHPDARLAMAGFATGAVLLACFGLAVACARLAHPEENRSSALRAFSLVTVAAGIGWMLHLLHSVVPIPPGDLQEILPTAFLIPLLALLLPTMFFVTEPECLGRRVSHTVPSNPVLAVLAAPFLPGGGRAFLLFALELVLLVSVGLFDRLRLTGAEPFGTDSDLAFLVGVCYAVFYMGLPSALLARRERRLPLLVAARLAIPLLAFLLLFLPSLVGFFIDHDDLMDFEHLGNAGMVVVELVDDGGVIMHATTVLPIVAAVVLLLNVPRMARGLREVLAASRDRRTRERRAPAA